jgi:hypothetical protein
MGISISKTAAACIISSLFFTPCFAASSSGVSEGVSVSKSVTADTPASSTSSADSWSKSGKKHRADDSDRYPLRIVQTGTIPFYVSISPKRIDNMVDKDIDIVFDSPDDDIAFVGLTFRDPYSKTLRHVPVTLGKKIRIVDREYVRYANEDTNLIFVITKKNGVKSTAVLDMHIAQDK